MIRIAFIVSEILFITGIALIFWAPIKINRDFRRWKREAGGEK